MTKTQTRVEVCLISARGLQRWSSLWKVQWFAVGWIDPKSKYCTKIDTSGSTNPTWRTKFSALIDGDDDDNDDSESKWQGLALHVQVYSRDAIFLREKLQGTAVVALKEFFAMAAKKKSEFGSNMNGAAEQLGSFQLRKKKSAGKAQGFIDVSIRIIRISEEEDHRPPPEISSYYAYPGGGHGFQLTATSEEENGISSQHHLAPSNHAEFYPQPQPQPQPLTTTTQTHHHNMPYNNYYPNPSAVGGPSYRPPPRTPPPPPPPSHVGYLPTFLPTTSSSSSQMPGTFMNIPSSSSTGAAGGGRSKGVSNTFGMGMGALAAGAVIFGDDFMSGFELPSTLRDGDDDNYGGLIISTDAPFQ